MNSQMPAAVTVCAPTATVTAVVLAVRAHRQIGRMRQAPRELGIRLARLQQDCANRDRAGDVFAPEGGRSWSDAVAVGGPVSAGAASKGALCRGL
jgi:hypothetical protein